MGDGEKYCVVDGKIYRRNSNEMQLVTCTVEEFLKELKKEGFAYEA